MIPSQGIFLVLAILNVCRAEEAKSTQLSNKRRPRGLDSFEGALNGPYGDNVASHINGYPQYLNQYQSYGSEVLLQGYDHGGNAGYLEYPGQNYQQYPVESIKRYAVKEDVDEGYVTTSRPVYLPRLPPRQPQPPQPTNGWTPIEQTVAQRAQGGKAIFLPNLSQDNYNIEVQNQLPRIPHSQPSVKTTYIPVEKVVGIPVPQPYSVPVYQPYPVAVPQPYPVEVPLPVQVQRTVEVSVDKPVPVPVIKHVPYNVVRNEHVPVPLPYPVPVPLYKTKYVVHSKQN